MDFINSFAGSNPTLFAILVLLAIVGFIYWSGRE